MDFGPPSGEGKQFFCLRPNFPNFCDYFLKKVVTVVSEIRKCRQLQRDIDVLHWLPISADTISYYCDGLQVCPSLRPLLPLLPLLPSVGFGSASRAAFCCEG